ncbi:hypothetical protein DSO57_1023973 [Entomophthora muscae]|uniref:Uncharacterized protein n=1 Tax=Entomophthora muscae TaxID=34485 RepID=A0ACC2S4R9_9FUNG|nr:hypothetical protein DSO57_1023973 [Entomophthora muscae]
MVGLIWLAVASGLLAYLPGGLKRVNYNKPGQLSDNFLTSIYKPSELLLPEALNTKERCIHNECVSIDSVTLHFHTSKKVSDPIACLALPCSLRSNIAINRTWEALDLAQFKRDDLELIFSKFLNLHLPKQAAVPSIAYEATTPSVYLLYCKPISWIVKGKYVKRYHKKAISRDFKVDLPLMQNDSYTNGAFGVADLCARDPASRPTTTAENHKVEDITTFYCHWVS